MEYNYKFTSGKNIWFTSDIHFNHKNIIKYCQRPWETVDEMNEALIANWNSVVKKDDTVFILGDIGFGSVTKTVELVSRLNGHKILLPGNHDREFIHKEEVRALFDDILPLAYIKIEEFHIYLCHFPFLCFDGAYSGEKATWQLFGHCHSKKGSFGLDSQRLIHCYPTQYDVGVDNNNYFPISFETVKEKIYDQQQSLNLIREC